MSDEEGARFKAFEAEGWSEQAATYGELSGMVTRRFAEPLLDAARVRRGDRVLDVATGPGYVAALAAARGATPIGLDISEGMLVEARRAHPALAFVIGDAEELPFESESFEAVVGNFVINHLPAPERGVAEAVRVLVEGGGVGFSAWHRPDRMLLMGLIGQAIEAAGVEDDERAAGIPPGPDGYRFADPDEFQRLLERAGLAEVLVEPVELVQRIAGPEELWRGFMGGSVRGSAFVRAQADAVQARIRESLEEVVEPYRSGDALEVPVAANIASGRKP
jgi:SAM-dependent methyltransferase